MDEIIRSCCKYFFKYFLETVEATTLVYNLKKILFVLSFKNRNNLFYFVQKKFLFWETNCKYMCKIPLITWPSFMMNMLSITVALCDVILVGLVYWTWQEVHCSPVASTVTRVPLSRASLGCGGTEHWHHGWPSVECYDVSIDQNLWRIFLTPCWSCA